MASNDHIDQPFIHSIKAYLANGFQGTIPLPPGKKHPPPEGHTGAKGKYPDIATIKAWCDQAGENYVDNANIGLRLGEVDIENRELPITYAGHIVTGWELIGIDVDTYKKKNGYEELLQLQKQYGVLPATVRSSSRWDHGTTSYIALFLVPKGYRYIGKAADCIDIIQKRHRYMVSWPSVNPDAHFSRYSWLGADDSPIDVPNVAYIPILPEAWWAYLTNNGQPESEDPISDMTGDELVNWAAEVWRNSDGDMCRHMAQAVTRHIELMSDAEDHHPHMTAAHWQILKLGSEGHRGWITGMIAYNDFWKKAAERGRNGAVDPEEINRSVRGALGKIEPHFGVLNDDPCDSKLAVENGEYNERLENFSFQQACACGDSDCTGCDVGRRIAENDYGGLGPVVGKLQIVKDKPTDGYGMHDEGNGQHFIDLYGDNAKYISTRKGWALWVPPDGSQGSGRWYADNDSKFASLAYQRVRKRQEFYARQVGIESAKDPQNGQLRKKATAWNTWSKRSGDLDPIRKALESSKRLYIDDQTPVTLNGKEFDANPRLMGCANGVLELTDDPEIRDPRRDDYVTYNTQVPYIPWRQLANNDDVNLDGFHLWQEYLRTFLPDEEIRHFIHKVMGHLLIGENPEKLLIFLYGTHDTGKSTMIGAIAGALGDYYGTIDMNLFKQKDLNPQLIRAVPLRVTGMSEVDAGVMDAATVKRLTGNDKVIAEAKYSNDIFEGRPQFTTVIACNNPPDINHADEALKERILALPFNTTIDRSIRKYERQTQIERYSGIAVLSWLVEGWRLYRAEGIKRDQWPRAVRQLHGEVVSAFNPTQSFIEAMLLKARECEDGMLAMNMAINKARTKQRMAPSPADWEVEWTPSSNKIYEMYVRWSAANGVQPLSHPAFTKELGVGKPLSRRLEGATAKVYVGVKIRDD